MITRKLPDFGPIRKPLRFLRRQLPPLNFITIHYLYFIITSLLSAIVFWGSSVPSRSVSFTDSLFLTVSAMTLAGLNTVNLSTLNTFQQFILFVLIMLGSAIFVSSFVVHVRRQAFVKKFVDVQERRSRGRRLSRVRTWATDTLGRRITEPPSGEETALNKYGEIQQLDGTIDTRPQDALSSWQATTPAAERDGRYPIAKAGENSSRDLTPPERRGGPEMNRLSTNDSNEPHRSLSPVQAETRAWDTSRSRITFRDDTHLGTPPQHDIQTRSISRSRPQRRGLFSLQGVGARRMSTLHVRGSEDLQAQFGPRKEDVPPTRQEQGEILKYFATATGWISRNSQFHGLTEQERDKLGGYEYRAVSFLAWLVPVYFVAWQLLSCLGCGAYVAINTPGTARTNGQVPWWSGAFLAVSAFNNSGMSLLDANMIAFQRSYYILFTTGLAILAGNTCYPLFLRLIVWCMYKLALRLSAKSSIDDDDSSDDIWGARARTLRFLLDHPRRCYTNLFPSQHTWWLALMVFCLNGIDWAAFEILNIGNQQLSDGLPLRYRVFDGLFQAVAVRSGGFYVVAIPTLRISLQVLYVAMMFISAFPILISIRNSNVYEERSLGIYAEDQEEDAGPSSEKTSEDTPGPLLRRAKTIRTQLQAATAAPDESNAKFVRHQLRAQLAHDTWFLILALFLIMIIEAHQFDKDPVVYSVFNFIFEIVSAYGCVGISVGVPYAAYSFCGSWSTLSKLILCAVMLRGRHRGLPVAIDKAVLLPGELQGNAEEEDGRIRRARTMDKLA